jgi:formate--tetrahydrofolate ligase
VLVATIRALKMHGGVAKSNLSNENIEAVKSGMSNLKRHVSNMKKFGLPVVVAINHFVADTSKELNALQEACNEIGVQAIPCYHWAKGGEGTIELAKKVVELAESAQNFKFLYNDEISLFNKIKTIATEIYHANDVVADSKVLDQLKQFEENGYGNFPICIAKTQYSFSTNPALKGAPSNHSIPIREVRLSSGAEFIVVVCGEIMTMPGLPSVPAANSIKLNNNGEIEGLF